MSLETEYVAFFQQYNPSGGGVEQWSGYCQGQVNRMASFGQGLQGMVPYRQGTATPTFGTARAAMLASGPLNGNLAQIVPGDVGYWDAWVYYDGDWHFDGHVAVCVNVVGADIWWMMASTQVEYQVGGVARNLGTVRHEIFQQRTGLTFRGFAKTNGGVVVPVELPAPPVPPDPGPPPSGELYTSPLPGEGLIALSERVGVPYETIQALNPWIGARQENGWNIIYPSDQIRYQ